METITEKVKEITITPEVEPMVQEIVVAPPLQVVERQHDASIEGFISQAIEKGLPIETMERFLQMRKEFKADQAREAFVIAMAQFQKECPVIMKTKGVKKAGSDVVIYRYAPLDSIVLQVKDALGNNNLAYSFREVRSEDGTKLTAVCTIRHSLGHSEDSSFTVEIGAEAYMTDVQKHGARMTFAKRYAFVNALGILTGDEDTDARELKLKPKAINPALDPKAKVISLLRALGVKDTKDADATREQILHFTQLDPTPENIPEIISRLSVLVEEQHEDN